MTIPADAFPNTVGAVVAGPGMAARATRCGGDSVWHSGHPTLRALAGRVEPAHDLAMFSEGDPLNGHTHVVCHRARGSSVSYPLRPMQGLALRQFIRASYPRGLP